MRRLRHAARLALCLLLWGALGVTHAFESVRIASDDRDAAGAPLMLQGFYAVPAGSGPFAAVVLMHGCGGAFTRGTLNERFVEAARRTNAAGHAALVLDSFGARGLRQVCTVPFKTRTVRQSHRRRDAFAALDWLAARPEIAPARIALIGWSHGGSTVLNVLAENDTRTPRYAGAIAFYPGCGAMLRRGAAFAPRTPFAILIGEADDWTPEPSCRALAARLQADAAPVTYRAYPGAHHGFDGTSALRVRKVPNTPSGTATVGSNPAARAAALAELDRLLADWLRP